MAAMDARPKGSKKPILIDAVFGEQHRETAAVIGLDRVGEGRQQRCARSVADGFRLARAYRWSGARPSPRN